MVTLRVAFQTAMRQAAVDLLEAFAADAGIALQVYPALPTSFYPPTAFVERIEESTTFPGPTQRQRLVRVAVIVLFRTFAEGERGDAAIQRDEFVDGFADWVLENYHKPGPTELISGTRVDDEPEYVLSDPKRGQITYFAARITLEGYTAN
jgi:hypothetical protein